MFLDMEERKDVEPVIARYSWGPRAENEFSKYSVLKFVANVSNPICKLTSI